MRILSFDVSSSTIGYSVLECDGNFENIKLVSASYLKPNKSGEILDRLIDTRNKIKTIIDNIKPDHIVIEDIIQFMAGKSTAKTIITLTAFNRMIGLLSFDYLNKSPTLINIMTIRHCIKREAKLAELPKKEDLPLILEKLIFIKFPWEFSKKNALKMENYDKADAISCAYCYIVNEGRKNDNSKARNSSGNTKRKTNK